MTSLELLYDIVRGPLALFAFLTFIIGTTCQVLRFLFLSKKLSSVHSKPVRRFKKQVIYKQPEKSIAQRLAAIKVSVFGVHPVMTTLTTIFHVCLVTTPFFITGHNLLIYKSWGINLFSLPQPLTHFMAQIVVVCGLVFFVRRIIVAQVRAITTITDYLVLLLTTVPFLTGLFAFHQTPEYHPIIILHMLSGELMLMLLPFTKLVHMPFFFINRFLINQENSFGRGIRTWFFGTPKFSFRRWYFGKNRFDIEKW